MVVPVFVVVSHITLELFGRVGGCARFHLNLVTGLGRVALVDLFADSSSTAELTFGVLLTLAVVAVLGKVLDEARLGALTVVLFGTVYLGRSVLGGRAVGGVEVTVVGAFGADGTILDVKLSLVVTTKGLLVVITSDFYTLTLCRLSAVVVVVVVSRLSELPLLVGVDFLLSAAGASRSLLFVDADVLFVARVSTVGFAASLAGSRHRLIASFVTFPSDAFRALLYFYLDCC